MKKTAIYLSLILVISSLAIVSNSAGQKSSMNASISNYGKILADTTLPIQTSSTSIPTKLYSGMAFYGTSSLNDSEISFIAQHFDLFICDFTMQPSVIQALKSKNPEILILGYADIIGVYTKDSYWTTVNAHEDWFLHDETGGRITNKQYGWYLMDTTSIGWQQFYVSVVNNKLNQSSFDGVFADDVWNQFYPALLNSSNIQNSVSTKWHTNMISMLQFIESNLTSTKKLIINTDEYLTNDYLNLVNGKLDETFAHASWWNSTDFQYQWFSPIDHINGMIRDLGTEKIFISCNGAVIPDNSVLTSQQISRIVDFCYTATLLGIENNAKSYFLFNSWYSCDESRGYYAIMDTNIGSPIGQYYLSQEVFMRNFTNGLVLFNPSNSTHQITLGQSYFLTDGTVVSSVVLQPSSGQILLFSPDSECFNNAS